MNNNPKIIPKLMPITPPELFLQQVKGSFDAVRYGRVGMDYIPAHMGGIFGQLSVLNEVVVLELTDFEVQ